MEIVSIEKRAFEELVAKFDRFVRRMDAICHRYGEKKMNEWMDNQDCAGCSTSAPARCRHFGTTELWHIAKSTTRPTTVPKMCSVSSPLWRTGGRKPDSKAGRYECSKQSIIQ